MFEDYYPDDDQDGYGDNSVPAVNSCSAIPGRVANARDCNDSDASISPDGVELCDGIDNDCDGPIDEEGAASIATTLYANVVDSIQAANQLTEARIDVCRGTHLLPDSTTVVTSDVTMIGGGVDVTTLQYMTDDARLEVHGELTVDGIAFRGTTSLGTAVVVEPDGDAVIRDSSFDDLSVAVLAEGTPLSGARVELDGVVITNCVGGIGARGNTNVEVSDTEVRDTPLVGFGSALFAESNPDGRPSVLLRDSLFEDNEGFYAGGITALGSDEGGFVDVQIERTTFRRNEGAAGAIWLDKANLAAVDSVVEFNEGAVVGGVRVSDGELAGLHIRDNEGTLGGGAGLTRARVVDCTIERNAAERGGGVHVGGGGMSSTDASTTIHGNVATVAGGGVYIDNAGFRSDSSDWGAAGSVDDNSLPEVFADGSNSSNGVVSTFAVEGGSWTCSASGQCITP
ncbi:MAG: putative metal-binding motif-containing protein [Myxococcota bacterium]